MGRARLRAGLVVLVAMLASLGLPGVALASTYDLHVVVQDATTITPLPGATVTVMNGSTTVATGVTGSNGVADILVANGTYAVSATATGYSPAPSQTAVVSGGQVNLTFGLSPDTTTTISGHLSDAHGGVAASQSIFFHGSDGSLGVGASDVSGYYSATVNKNASYTIELKNSNTTPPGFDVPAIYDLTETAPVAAGSAPVTLDLTLPEVKVGVCVYAGGTGLSGVQIATSQAVANGLSMQAVLNGTATSFASSASDSYSINDVAGTVGYPFTDATGCATLWLFPSAATRILTVMPHTTAYAVASYPETIQADGSLSFPVAAPVSWSGTLLDGSGAPLAGMHVQVQQAGLPGATLYPASPGDTDPNFTITGLQPDASYYIEVTPDQGAAGKPFDTPEYFDLRTTAAIAATSLPSSLQLPEIAVPVVTTANGGAMAVAGATLTTPNVPVAASGMTFAGEPATGSDYTPDPGWVVTGSGGTGTMWLLPAASPYTVTAVGPAGRTCYSDTESVSVPASGPVAPVAFHLVCNVSAGGSVTLGGAGLAGQAVTATAADGTARVVLSGAGGSFYFPSLPPGPYVLSVSGGGPGTGLPAYTFTQAAPVDLEADRSGLVLALPLSAVKVTVVDGSLAPVSGAELDVSPGTASAAGITIDYTGGAPSSDSSGRVTLWLVAGAWSLVARSGVLAGFQTLTLPGPAAVTIRLGYDTDYPVVRASVSPAPNAAGWNDTPVTVSWTATDDFATTQCAATTVSADTASTTVSCTSTDSGDLSTTDSVTVKVDRTPPTVTWSGPVYYTVDQDVSLSCGVSDALSGPVSASCGTVGGHAWAIGPGTYTVSGTGYDVAGNSTTKSVSYTVAVTAGSLCNLVRRWEANAGIANSLCVKLEHGSITAFENEVEAQRGKTLLSWQADVLLRLASALS